MVDQAHTNSTPSPINSDYGGWALLCWPPTPRSSRWLGDPCCLSGLSFQRKKLNCDSQNSVSQSWWKIGRMLDYNGLLIGKCFVHSFDAKNRWRWDGDKSAQNEPWGHHLRQNRGPQTVHNLLDSATVLTMKTYQLINDWPWSQSELVS